MIHIEVPISLPSVANLREHWSVKARRVKSQRAATFMVLGLSRVLERMGGRGAVAASQRILVTLTRVSPRKLDGDNLQGAFKGVRDEVARFFGVDDGDESRITFAYDQVKSKPSCVRIGLDIQERP